MIHYYYTTRDSPAIFFFLKVLGSYYNYATDKYYHLGSSYLHQMKTLETFSILSFPSILIDLKFRVKYKNNFFCVDQYQLLPRFLFFFLNI